MELSDIPLKKPKLDEYANVPFNIQLPSTMINYDPVYMQIFQDHLLHISAFKPFPHSIKDNKLSMGFTRYIDPPILQHPERVVPLSQTEHFEGGYQPNVALAPPAPRKHRYIRQGEQYNKEIKEPYPTNEVTSSVQKNDTKPSVIKQERYSSDLDSPKSNVIQKSPDSQNIIDSTVSVVQSTGKITRYNSEIELSTDTDDSASESSEKQSELSKVEEIIKNVNADIKQKVVEFVKSMLEEHERVLQDSREKDNKMMDLENRVRQLEKQLDVAERSKSDVSSLESPRNDRVESQTDTPPPEDLAADNQSTPTLSCDNNNESKDDQQEDRDVVENSSSIFYETTGDVRTEDNQTSVIATVDKQDSAIIKNEPE